MTLNLALLIKSVFKFFAPHIVRSTIPAQDRFRALKTETLNKISKIIMHFSIIKTQEERTLSESIDYQI